MSEIDNMAIGWQQKCKELERQLAELQAKHDALKGSVYYLAKWIERGIYSTQEPIDALKVIAHDPIMPWNRGIEWDVNHLSYREAFYSDFPQARPKK